MSRKIVKFDEFGTAYVCGLLAVRATRTQIALYMTERTTTLLGYQGDPSKEYWYCAGTRESVPYKIACMRRNRAEPVVVRFESPEENLRGLMDDFVGVTGGEEVHAPKLLREAEDAYRAAFRQHMAKHN